MYLACQCESLCSVQDMARVLAVSFNHLQKATQALARAGFVETRRGKGGGTRLARDPEDITVGEVVRALEPMEPVECWREDNQCVLTPSCALIGIIDEALEVFFEQLDAVTLAAVCDRPMRKRLLKLSNDGGSDLSMQTCPRCRALVHERAPECPACDLRLLPRRYTWLWVIGAILAAGVTWYFTR